jgi:hypothetical protein
MPDTVGTLRDGPPWEHRASLGLFGAIKETVKGVLLDPSVAFARMKREGGLAEPLQYLLLIGSVCGFMPYVYNIIFQLAGGADNNVKQYEAIFRLLNNGHAPPPEATNAFAAAHLTGTAMVETLIGALFLLPIVLLLFSFIWAGIVHLSLMFLNGANQPFETTYRVVCYCGGSAAVFQLIPMCGAWICLIWNIVSQCIGIAKAHEISTGKAVAAVLLPMVICCGAFVAFLALIFAIAFGLASHH